VTVAVAGLAFSVVLGWSSPSTTTGPGRRGHRHGLDFRVMTSAFVPFGAAITYRFYPRKLDRMYPKG